ncbi:MAG: GatB/YqeY domain-containing protein [Gammaproteobacteria bacterium]|nr:GatB/YqeY domain-containing protein [Gammaproteobacteria bacterium]MCW8983637.1 GatB/YqeY domain-containing protein [Gammaproteobacteria bacterium]
MSDSLKQRIQADMKSAMKNKEKELLLTIRTILAAIKQIEVDERIEVDDTRVLAVLDKMVKQRRDSIKQFNEAGRDELSAVEQAEIEIIQTYLPAALSEEEINQIIKDAIAESGAASMKEMGKVMAIVKPKVQGRGDMGVVSGAIKALLG